MTEHERDRYERRDDEREEQGGRAPDRFRFDDEYDTARRGTPSGRRDDYGRGRRPNEAYGGLGPMGGGDAAGIDSYGRASMAGGPHDRTEDEQGGEGDFYGPGREGTGAEYGSHGSMGGYGRDGGAGGHGPDAGHLSGQRRSDERIAEDVSERLARHGAIDAGAIEVEVQGGEVTLRGTVDSRRTKRMAEETIEDVAGVVDVHNQLRIGQPGASTASEDAGSAG